MGTLASADARLRRPTFLSRVADAFASIADRFAVQGSDPYLSELSSDSALSMTNHRTRNGGYVRNLDGEIRIE